MSLTTAEPTGLFALRDGRPLVGDDTAVVENRPIPTSDRPVARTSVADKPHRLRSEMRLGHEAGVRQGEMLWRRGRAALRFPPALRRRSLRKKAADDAFDIAER
ncbi:MAG: hypothetical protein K5831_09150 [Brevundimonas sp.]|uniref:hypothetical protein n=1 Tax=Brevundimonas sp. TaxID=1871086 RepID=UPI0019C9A5A7|nr:hypothetical protein [Brevundimonas sp.]MBD3835963.1 hypothetical protein [Brevundimonas sp.]MCV0415034.1 hypothetical protein [Brevundimonas sp.]